MSKKNDISSNNTIREAIQKIALRGVIDKETGAIRGSSYVSGYVTKIHTEGKLAGTVDVQEYNQIAVEETKEAKLGFHEGVLLSALQDNSKGMLIVPKLYSDVAITTSPVTQQEYVLMFSHVDVIQLDSHDTVSVGVKEREPFDENDTESPDIEDLPETGVYSNITFQKDSIDSVVQAKDKAQHSNVKIDSTQIKQTVGDDKSSITTTQKSIEAKHDKSALLLNDSEATTQAGASKVKVTDGTVYMGSDSGTDDAVLGVELANLLSELMGVLGQIITPTMMGPQPATNIASFMSLKAKIDAFKSSHSGFLTKKVQIQK